MGRGTMLSDGNVAGRRRIVIVEKNGRSQPRWRRRGRERGVRACSAMVDVVAVVAQLVIVVRVRGAGTSSELNGRPTVRVCLTGEAPLFPRSTGSQLVLNPKEVGAKYVPRRVVDHVVGRFRAAGHREIGWARYR